MRERTYIASFFFLVLLVQGLTVSFKQSSWEVITMAAFEKKIKPTEDKYNGGTSYQVKFSVASFKGHASTTAHDTQKGILKRSGNNFLNSLLGLTSIQNNKYHYVIDSTDESIMIKDPMNSKDYEFITDSYKQLKRHVTKIEYLEKNEVKQFKIFYTEKINLALTEIHIDKSGSILKSITYYRNEINEDPANPESKKSKPKVELKFYDYKTIKSTDFEKEINDANFFYATNGKFIGSGKFKNYKVTDNRYKPR